MTIIPTLWIIVRIKSINTWQVSVHHRDIINARYILVIIKSSLLLIRLLNHKIWPAEESWTGGIFTKIKFECF